MNWILLAGLVRDPANALEQAKQIRRLMDKGLVQGSVFSTWHGEFERYPEVREAFLAIGTVLVECPQPTLRFPGHILHQSLSLQWGLEHIPANVRVLRIRPDIVPMNELIDYVLGGDWLTRDYGLGLEPTAYSHRVWAHSGLVGWPFYLNDILFYGYKADIARLSNVDLKHEYLYSELAPEQFYHLGPIAAVNPVLDLYARVQRNKHSASENRRLTQLLWDSDFWYDVLYAQAKELLSNYVVGFMDPSIIYSEPQQAPLRDLSLREVLSPDSTIPFMHTNPVIGSPDFHSLNWAYAVVNDSFRSDETSTRLNAAKDRSLGQVTDNAYAYAEEIRQAFPHYQGPVRPASEGLYYRPHKHLNIQAQASDEYAKKLEEEINHLRRQIG
ncbi:hypothetical protein [Asticcacaulis sp. YBE204]|uniref:hypothetical protein n=1 Tax=Asticcacaulis sp. YBE204 TaxID=1282363 RepID=UPI0003C3E4FF|nr:hypothetical protein [Asticcacaulis sp. YBE204]ESQ78650.1 hypothetical protein AEYBE204_13950 [Asticcacaulis sp. YBE204]